MPTVDEFWTVAAQVASERGGLVVGVTGEEQPELGSTLDNVLGFQSRGPVTVIGRAEWDDWTRQTEAFYRLRPAWGRGHPGDPGARYYRIKFDEQDAMRGNPTLSAGLSSGSSFSTLGLSESSFGGYTEVRTGLRGETFGPRAAARLIDLILQYALGYAAGRLFLFMIFFSSGGHPPPWVLLRLSRGRAFIYLGSFLGLFFYQVISTTICGSSLGKRLCSLQVLQDDGSRCRLRSAVIRELGYYVDALFFGLIGYSAMRGTEEQQRYGDEWAGTIVCRMSDVPAPSRQTGIQFALGQTIGVAACLACMLLGLLLQMRW
jgi:uncharacterized RDD family membrane protein YckC